MIAQIETPVDMDGKTIEVEQSGLRFVEDATYEYVGGGSAVNGF